MSTTQKSASIRTSFFRSVGLKALTDGFKSVKTKISYSPLEEKKVIVSTSRWIALSRTGVHLLPVSISIFLIVFNSIEFPNGPEISSVATFFLQVVAKFHVGPFFFNKIQPFGLTMVVCLANIFWAGDDSHR